MAEVGSDHYLQVAPTDLLAELEGLGMTIETAAGAVGIVHHWIARQAIAADTPLSDRYGWACRYVGHLLSGGGMQSEIRD